MVFRLERTYGIGIILGVCGLILLIGILKKNAEILLNFVARTVVRDLQLLPEHQHLNQQV